ncbi:MAG TPA: histidine kinase dimerization/phospho-acceptor domain-containing protein [Bdellovibrionales bacterium]|nr:histidine kinase dimerization/phospho-acceptor domain-containing protein [Bdellovibrionales bacterium]
MRNSISARIFILLSLVLVGALAAAFWKAQSLFDHNQKKLAEEHVAKISAEVAKLTSDRIKVLNDELLRYVFAREKNASNKDVPKSWWGTFTLVSTAVNNGQGWTARWFESSLQSPVQQWPTGSVEKLLEEIRWDQARGQARFIHRVSDPQKQPLFALVTALPHVDPTSTVKHVAVGILSPVALADLVSNHKGGAQTVAIIDRQGMVYSHPSAALIGSSMERNSAVRDIMNNGELTQAEYAKTLAGAQAVDGTNLFVVTSQATGAVLRGTRSLAASFAVIGLGLLLLAGAFSLYFSRWYASPLRRVTEFVRAIGTGGEPDLDGPSFKEVEELVEAVTQTRIQILNQIEDENRRRQSQSRGERGLLLKGVAGSLGQEIKNPLIGILGHAQLAKDKAGGREELKKHFDAIEKEARKTKTIVDNLLKFAGAEKLDFSSINYFEAVSTAIAQVEPYLQAKGIKVVKHLSPVPRVIGNYGQLRQALVSLLLHQGKSMERTLSKQLTVYLEAVDGRVVTRFEDTGEGLSDDYRQTAFEPNPSNLSDPTFELAAVHGVIATHQGEISLASTIGKGNVFTISIAAEAGAQVTGLAPEPKRSKISEIVAQISQAQAPSAPVADPAGLDFDEIAAGTFEPVTQLKVSEEVRDFAVSGTTTTVAAGITEQSPGDLSIIDEGEAFSFRKNLPLPDLAVPNDFLPAELSVDLPPPPPALAQQKEESFRVVVRKPRLKV